MAILAVEDFTTLMFAEVMAFALDALETLPVGEGLALPLALTEVGDGTGPDNPPSVIVPFLVGLPTPSVFSDTTFSSAAVPDTIVSPVAEAALGEDVAATLSVLAVIEVEFVAATSFSPAEDVATIASSDVATASLDASAAVDCTCEESSLVSAVPSGVVSVVDFSGSATFSLLPLESISISVHCSVSFIINGSNEDYQRVDFIGLQLLIYRKMLYQSCLNVVCAIGRR